MKILSYFIFLLIFGSTLVKGQGEPINKPAFAWINNQANLPVREAIDKLWEKLQQPPLSPLKDKKNPKEDASKQQDNTSKQQDNTSKQQDNTSKQQDNTSKQQESKLEERTQQKPAKQERTQQSSKGDISKPKTIYPQGQKPAHACTVELKVEGVIGPASLNSLNRAIQEVKKQQCASLLLLINTPGGQLLSTRKIVDQILNTDFPVLCLIYPAGAHAGSAGAIIMQACHVNGGLETTNIGAATPIMGGGSEMSKDLRKKVINDTTSWLDSLTTLRKRSQKFGREIITKAKALSANEAHKEGALDFVGQTKEEFLQFAEGRETLVKDGHTHIVQVGSLVPLKLGFRHHVISLITEPELVYILFTGSLLLLYFEITHPGLGAPGILGAMGLVLSFIGMHKLDFSYAGLILILLSVALFLAEVFIAGFGIFGVGGVISFVLGSILLFDPAKTGGVDIPLSLIFSVSTFFSLLMGLIAYMAYRTFRMKKTLSISDDFMDPDALPAEVVYINQDEMSGLVFINGENWRFTSKQKVKKGDKVRVLKHHHLILEVQPLSK